MKKREIDIARATSQVAENVRLREQEVLKIREVGIVLKFDARFVFMPVFKKHWKCAPDVVGLMVTELEGLSGNLVEGVVFKPSKNMAEEGAILGL